MYPELMVIPMREELARAGIKETRTPEAVDAAGPADRRGVAVGVDRQRRIAHADQLVRIRVVAVGTRIEARAGLAETIAGWVVRHAFQYVAPYMH